MNEFQERLYNCIVKYIREKGIRPTHRELQELIGCSSVTLSNNLRVLVNEGYIIKQGRLGMLTFYLPLEELEGKPRTRLLSEAFPDIYRRLDFNKLQAQNIEPKAIAYKSNLSYPFICDKNSSHEFMMSLTNMTRYGLFHCPICSHRRLAYEDSLECYCKKNGKEELLKEYSKENKKRAGGISYNYKGQVLWNCYIHNISFNKSPYERTVLGRECPTCSKYGKSDIACAIEYYLSTGTNGGCKGEVPLKELYCKEEVPLKKIRGRVDVLLEYQKLAIEYDGVWSHSLKGAKEKDKKKQFYFK